MRRCSILTGRPIEGIGLYQGEKLGAQTRSTYLQALSAFYQVKLAEMLLLEIDAAGQDDEYLYESLKHYLMLFNPQKMDQESFKTWAQILWRKHLPQANQAAVIENLLAHMDVVFSHKLSPPPIDTLRVARSRLLLNETPLELRIYRRIKDAWARDRQHFSVASVLGPRGQNYFERTSNERIDLGVPALFTYRGFHTGYKVERLSLAKQLSDEQWIYGKATLSPGNATDNAEQASAQSSDLENANNITAAEAALDESSTLSLTNTEIADLGKRVDAHYFRDYIAHWERFLNDVTLKQFADIESGWKIVRGLAGADQPLNTFAQAVRQNLALDALPKPNSDTLAQAADATGSSVLNRAAQLQRLVPDQLTDSVEMPGAEVSAHFTDWIDYTDANTTESLAQLEQIFLSLNDTFSEVMTASDTNLASFQLMASKRFKQDARLKNILVTAPPSFQGWFNGFGQASRSVFAAGARAHINAAWRSQILPLYRDRLAGRYPLNGDSAVDASRKDFTDFFGPQGVVSAFYGTYIKPFVRQRGDRLRWRSYIGLRNRTLATFESLSKIQEAYFSGAEGQLYLEFYLTPHSLDRSAVGITINLGDVKYRYAHGPIRSERFHWPQGKHEQTVLTLVLVGQGTPVTIINQGEWNWFRLLDQAKATPEDDQIKLYFKFKSLETEHYLRPTGTVNPFKNRLVDTLKLPKTL